MYRVNLAFEVLRLKRWLVLQVISGEDHLKEAALKEVLCRSQSELQQAQWRRWALGLASENW